MSKVGTRDEWRAARIALLEREKELTRLSDELARERQELPWVPVEKEYSFDTDEGTKTLADLFDGRSQLLVYHFMFGPEYTAGCPTCSSIADSFDGSIVHLNHHDVTMLCISRAPLQKLRGLQAADGLELPVGLIGGKRFQLRLRRLVHREAAAGRGRVQLPGLPDDEAHPGSRHRPHRRAGGG